MPSLDEVKALITDFYKDKPDSTDEKATLLSELNEMNELELNKTVHACMRQAMFEYNAADGVKTMSDGTKYKVTKQGWQKLDA